QAAGSRHQRDRAIAHGIKLGKPAGLEAGGLQQDVGAAEDQVRGRFVVADMYSHLSAVAGGARGKRSLDLAITLTAYHQLTAVGEYLVDHVRQHVGPLLPGKPAQGGEYRAAEVLETEMLEQG